MWRRKQDPTKTAAPLPLQARPAAQSLFVIAALPEADRKYAVETVEATYSQKFVPAFDSVTEAATAAEVPEELAATLRRLLSAIEAATGPAERHHNAFMHGLMHMVIETLPEVERLVCANNGDKAVAELTELKELMAMAAKISDGVRGLLKMEATALAVAGVRLAYLLDKVAAARPTHAIPPEAPKGALFRANYVAVEGAKDTAMLLCTYFRDNATTIPADVVGPLSSAQVARSNDDALCVFVKHCEVLLPYITTRVVQDAGELLHQAHVLGLVPDPKGLAAWMQQLFATVLSSASSVYSMSMLAQNHGATSLKGGGAIVQLARDASQSVMALLSDYCSAYLANRFMRQGCNAALACNIGLSLSINTNLAVEETMREVMDMHEQTQQEAQIIKAFLLLAVGKITERELPPAATAFLASLPSGDAAHSGASSSTSGSVAPAGTPQGSDSLALPHRFYAGALPDTKDLESEQAQGLVQLMQQLRVRQ